MFRQRSHSASSDVAAKIAPSTSTNTATTAATETAQSPPTTSSPPTKKFGFSEIANLFIRLRRHQSRASLASQARKDEEAAATTVTASPQTEDTPRPFPTNSPLAASENATSPSSSAPAHMSRLVLTPPPTPSRNRVRRLTGSPYSRRSRTMSESTGKPKPHHLVSSSGEEPITNPGLVESQFEGAHPLPVEYTDRFECAGGVNTQTLVRATKRAILEAVGNLGANALIDEKWDCTICGPKHGTYKVQINYSATATRCARLDGCRPVALDKAKSIPGLMTITKRNEE